MKKKRGRGKKKRKRGIEMNCLLFGGGRNGRWFVILQPSWGGKGEGRQCCVSGVVGFILKKRKEKSDRTAMRSEEKRKRSDSGDFALSAAGEEGGERTASAFRVA